LASTLAMRACCLVQAVRLARGELAGGDAGVDPGLLVRLALVDARRGGAGGERAERGDR
jgi:hypothetical protein